MGLSVNTKKYASIYIWQGLAFFLKIVSMFIVVPFLTKDPSTYGIYSICISVTIFLGYADLGFLRSGQKFASECYILNDREGEMKYIGFGFFILIFVGVIFTIIFTLLSLSPELIIKDNLTEANRSVSSKLFFLLAFFTPFNLIMRLVSIIFEIRLENYLCQRISLVGSLLIISSVLYFFRNNSYEIVNYFAFMQVVNLGVILVCIVIAKKRYEYDFLRLISFVKYDNIIYNSTKKLAYSSVYLMLSWILFYEFDSIAIGKILGLQYVAYFSVAFVIPNFFRNIFSIIFSPFTIRANYFIANLDESGLETFIVQVLTITAPIILFSTINIAFFSSHFITCWVGENFKSSIHLAIIFSLFFSFSFISFTVGLLLTAKLRVKEMNMISTIQPLLYWAGIMITIDRIGLLSFAYFKLFAILAGEFYYFTILSKYLNRSIYSTFILIFRPIFFPLIILIILSVSAIWILPLEKSKVNLLIILLTSSGIILISCLVVYFNSVFLKKIVNQYCSWSTLSKINT